MSNEQIEFESSVDDNEHTITSRQCLTEKDTGRVVAVFYNDYDLQEVVDQLESAHARYAGSGEAVGKPYAYEYGETNWDGTYSVVITRGDLVKVGPGVYEYVRPLRAHKDWPVKELFEHPSQPKVLEGHVPVPIKTIREAMSCVYSLNAKLYDELQAMLTQATKEASDV